MKQLGFKSNVFLAPMAGITDKPMRQLVSSFGTGVMVSEMVAINAIQRKNPKSYHIADVRDEAYPVVVQLVGGDAALFADVVKLIEDLGAYSIDINMGCPVKKIVNNHSGSALMQDMQSAAEIIRTVVKNTKLMTSVKFRKGWDHQHENAVDFARMCEDCGAAYVTVHGRTRSDFYSGEADWDAIAAVKQAVKIPVIGNGDVTSIHKAKAMLEHTKADGVMIGRAALGAPWLISQIHDYIHNGIEPAEVTPNTVKQTFLKHLQALVDYHGERLALPLSRKYAGWYSRGLRDAKRFRETYNRLTTMEEALAEIHRYFDSCTQQDEE